MSLILLGYWIKSMVRNKCDCFEVGTYYIEKLNYFFCLASSYQYYFLWELFVFWIVMGNWCVLLPYISFKDIGNIFPYYYKTGITWKAYSCINWCSGKTINLFLVKDAS